MSLPSIKVTLPLLFVLWCVGACLAGMWPLLAYPVMWAAVGGLLYGLHVATGSKETGSNEAGAIAPDPAAT